MVSICPRRELQIDQRKTDEPDFIAMLGEYVGTVLFMIFALGGTK
jgi:hypothetical protein